MKVKYIHTSGNPDPDGEVVISDIQETIKNYDRQLKDYEIADEAYMLALQYLKEHPDITLANIDYDWFIL